MTKHTFAHFIWIVLISSYSSHAYSDPRRTQQFSFEGMVVPGNIVNAKNSGFSDCKVDYYHYKCTKHGPLQILGATASGAKVYLDGNNNFYDNYFASNSGDARRLNPDQLSYRSIIFDFKESTYDAKCLKRMTASVDNKPLECVKFKGKEYFIERLTESGWVFFHWYSSSGSVYVRKNTPAAIAFRSHGVELYPVTVEEANDMYNSAVRKMTEEMENKRRSNSVMDYMKK